MKVNSTVVPNCTMRMKKNSAQNPYISGAVIAWPTALAGKRVQNTTKQTKKKANMQLPEPELRVGRKDDHKEQGRAQNKPKQQALAKRKHENPFVQDDSMDWLS